MGLNQNTKYLPGPPSLRPHCTACGHYLLPCTATPNGIHPEIAGAGHLAPSPKEPK